MLYMMAELMHSFLATYGFIGKKKKMEREKSTFHKTRGGEVGKT